MKKLLFICLILGSCGPRINVEMPPEQPEAITRSQRAQEMKILADSLTAEYYKKKLSE